MRWETETGGGVRGECQMKSVANTFSLRERLCLKGASLSRCSRALQMVTWWLNDSTITQTKETDSHKCAMHFSAYYRAGEEQSEKARMMEAGRWRGKYGGTWRGQGEWLERRGDMMAGEDGADRQGRWEDIKSQWKRLDLQGAEQEMSKDAGCVLLREKHYSDLSRADDPYSSSFSQLKVFSSITFLHRLPYERSCCLEGYVCTLCHGRDVFRHFSYKPGWAFTHGPNAAAHRAPAPALMPSPYQTCSHSYPPESRAGGSYSARLRLEVAWLQCFISACVCVVYVLGGSGRRKQSSVFTVRSRRLERCYVSEADREVRRSAR